MLNRSMGSANFSDTNIYCKPARRGFQTISPTRFAFSTREEFKLKNHIHQQNQMSHVHEKSSTEVPNVFTKLQRGLSLIESLIALVVLAVGVMGLAGLQARMLVESRTANHRAVAIGFIDDLSNRMLLNRDAAMANSYTLAWNGTKAKKDCTTAPCTGADLAQSDLNLWRLALRADALPNANARYLSVNHRPLARLVSRSLGLPMNA
jgi:type IV pilus modification protein PilV